MRPLRIAMVAFPSPGGSGVVAMGLADHLAQRGHDVTLVASARPFRWPDTSAVRFCPVELSDHPLFNPPSYVWSLAATLIEQHQRQPFDLVHVHYAVPHAVGAALVGESVPSAPPKLVVTLHGTDVTQQGRLPGPHAMTRWALLHAHALTAPSQFLRREALQIYQPPATQPFEVISNFVDLHAFVPAATPPAPWRLLHVSNLRPVKRVRDVVKVFARVAAEVPAELVVVGQGPERPAMEDEARQAGVAAAVRFAGPDADTATWLRQSHLLLLPSESESFGLVALEAMAAGVPVIASNAGGLPEVVEHGRGGWLAPVGQVDAMAGHALQLLREPQLYEQQREAARQRALAIGDASPVVTRYERLYRSLFEVGD